MFEGSLGCGDLELAGVHTGLPWLLLLFCLLAWKPDKAKPELAVAAERCQPQVSRQIAKHRLTGLAADTSHRTLTTMPRAKSRG